MRRVGDKVSIGNKFENANKSILKRFAHIGFYVRMNSQLSSYFMSNLSCQDQQVKILNHLGFVFSLPFHFDEH